MIDLTGRDFLKLLDYTPEEINYLLDVAARLKAEKKAGAQPGQTLHKTSFPGKNIALIFEKNSTRTRCSFEVAAADLGRVRPTSDRPVRRSAARSRSRIPHAC